jgi:hypothetical protein
LLSVGLVATLFDSLRPDVWAQMHPDSIRTYRREERQEQAARRHRNRLERRLNRLNQLKQA